MYGSSSVRVHKVTLNVPNKYFASGSLPVEFTHNMIHTIETESGGIDSFRISAYFADCQDGQLATATKPEVTVYSGAATTMWMDGMLSCTENNVWLECFGDPTANAQSYPRTAQVFFSESYDGYVCTQDVCDDCIGSITVNKVTKLEDGATFFDLSSDDFIFASFGIEAGGGFSRAELAPPMNEAIGIGNRQETSAVSHLQMCLSILGNTRKLEAETAVDQDLQAVEMIQAATPEDDATDSVGLRGKVLPSSNDKWHSKLGSLTNLW